MNAAVVTSLHSSSSGFGKGGGRKKSNKTRVFCQWLQKRSRLGGKVWRATEKRFSGIFSSSPQFLFFGKPSAQVHLVSAGEIGRVLEEGREGRFVRSFGGGSVCISSLIYPSLSLSTSASKVPFLLPQGGGGGEGGWCGEGGAI